MKSPLTVAVIGTGSAGKRHLSQLCRLANVESIAISKREGNFEKLKGASHCIIASDTSCHVEDALMAMEEVGSLLIEKPLAVDAVSALPLFLRAKKQKQIVRVGCVLRFSESLNQFKHLLEKIGSVYSVRIECQSYLPEWRSGRDYRDSYSARKEEGGVLRDLIHEIDYAGWLFGWPGSLQARLSSSHHLEIAAEEMAELWWETENKISVSICLDYLARIPRRVMTAFGEKGVLTWNGVKNETVLEIPGTPPALFQSSQTRDEMFLKQAETFLHGGPMATLEEGIRALAICDAARVASANKKETLISYPH